MADPARLYVVVTGPPASGKSTLAPGLADALGLPLVAKDAIDLERPASEL
jgi:adenylate kinase family enzyme